MKTRKEIIENDEFLKEMERLLNAIRKDYDIPNHVEAELVSVLTEKINSEVDYQLNQTA